MTEPLKTTDSPAPKKLLRVIYKFILISLGVHVVALLIFGGAVVISKLQPEEVTFEVAPPVVRVEPKKRQYKLRAQQQQKRSSRPVLQQRMQSTRMSSVSLPTMKTNITPVKQKTARIPGMSEGMGEGLSFGGGMGSGMIFGVNINANRLGVLLDVSNSTHKKIHLAVEEIQKSFPDAIIVLVPGCGMRKSQSGGIVYTMSDFTKKKKSLRTGRTYDIVTSLDALLRANKDFKSMADKISRDGNLFVLHIGGDNGHPYYGTQAAFDFLMQERVDAIYWFADFIDTIEDGVASQVVNELKGKRVAVYQQVVSTGKAPFPNSLKISKQTGGKVIKSK